MKKPWESKWQKFDQIGSGGQGTVHIVSSLDSDRKGALKVLKSQNNMERRSRMYREISVLISLEGRGINIPLVIDHNIDRWRDIASNLYAVMDYIPGSTLDKYVSETGPLTFEHAIILMKSLLKTVSKCHEYGILHRDIKPDNIILCNNAVDNPIIIDFGLSFNKDSEAEIKTDTEQQMGNRFLLLPEFTTPNKDPEFKRQFVSDITQLIGVFFYVLTGARPMTLRDDRGRMPHQRDDFTYKQLPVGPSLDLMFSTGFSYETSKRIQTAESFLEWIENIINQKITSNKSSLIALEKFRESNLESEKAKERWQTNKCDEILTNIIDEFSNYVAKTTDGTFIASRSGRYDGGFDEIQGKYHYGVNIHEPNLQTVNYRVHWIGGYEDNTFLVFTKEPTVQEKAGVRQIGNEDLIVNDAKGLFDNILTRAIEYLTKLS